MCRSLQATSIRSSSAEESLYQGLILLDSQISILDMNEKVPIFQKTFSNFVQISPSFDPTNGDSSTPLILNYSLPFSQVWRRSGSCPDGTIPIRRVLKHHLLNASSLERYGKKNTNVITKRDFRMLEHTFAVGIENYHTVSIS